MPSIAASSTHAGAKATEDKRARRNKSQLEAISKFRRSENKNIFHNLCYANNKAYINQWLARHQATLSRYAAFKEARSVDPTLRCATFIEAKKSSDYLRARAENERLSGPPMIGDPLVAEVPHARNKRLMALFFCPVDRGVLGLCRVQHVIGVVLDHVVGYRGAIAPLRSSFNINIGHTAVSPFAGCIVRRDTTLTFT